ncbi:MAG: alpha/beta hydrolase fold domain-containing protein [Phycisphaera sp.]|nr:alpha/beta hydrolase fold domain-containing protein [Phycisphaera sp.]
MNACLTAFFLLTIGVCVMDASADYPPKIEASRVVTYKTVGDVELKLWFFEPKEHKAHDKTPAIVFFFGGGWKGGTPTQFEPHARYLASRGMVTIVADYRVESRNKTTPIECVKDGCSAVRYLRSHADELGIDPDRIAAGGGSAGGHVAAATATVTAFNEETDDTTVSCVPDALVLFNPVFDNGPGGYGHERVKDYWQKFSPIDNIREGLPPSITFLGTKDGLIPVATVERWKTEAEKVGSRAEVHFYEGGVHGFFNKSRSEAFYKDTLDKTDRFLTSLGYLEGEPTVSEP